MFFQVVPHGVPQRRHQASLLVGICLVVTTLLVVCPGTVGVRLTAPAVGDAAALVSPARIITIEQQTWINVTPAGKGNSPPAASGGMSAYDPVDNETVYFGGCLDANCSAVSNQTWVFSKGVWTNVTNPHSAPPASDYGSMDFDSNMGGVLLFGGTGPKGAALNDTWLFHAGAWINVTSYGTPPPARWGAAMTFDPQPEENGSVLFGGYGPGTPTGYLNDTWVWQGDAGWVRLKSASTAPPEVVDPAMAYDPSAGYVVETGGYLLSGADSKATWELYSGQWWAVQPGTSAPALTLEAMVYDPALSGVLLFGGLDGATGYQTNQTWLFYSGDWSERSPSTAPPATYGDGFALDGTGTTPIAVGGFNGTRYLPVNTTWAYEYAPYISSVTSNVSSSEVGDDATFSATVEDGTSPYSVEFTFGDGTYAFVSGPGPTLSVSHAFIRNGTFNVIASATDAVGAVATPESTPFTVSHAPSVTASVVGTTGDVGVPLSFVCSVVSPGTAPLTFAWAFGDAGTATTQNASHAYAATGTFTATVVATDAHHATASASVVVTVVAAPTVAVAAAPAHPAADAPITFYANVTGGSGSYTYTWRFGDGASSALPDPTHAYSTAGSHTAVVYINDSAGGFAHAPVTVTVGPASSSATTSSSGLAGAPVWFWGGLGALAAAGAGGSVVLIRRGRARKP